MVRVRKLVLAIAAATALSSGMAHALGVGELTLQSSLNQPLVAEIELLDVRDLSAAEVRPTLASPEEFNKAGVDRQYFLTDLTFTPLVKPNGKSVIRVTSTKPVREPYLNFLVEVLWPNGRLLREYTLLLDPPLYSPQAAAAPQLPVVAPAPVPRPAPNAAPRATVPVTSAPAAPRAASAGGDYRTNANDTLWEVAQRAGGSGSVHQKMLAIQDLNPNAFIGGNINRMKSGQVLRLPDDQQIASRSQAQALAQVNEQNSSWRQSRSAPAAAGTRQIDATRRTGAGAAPAQVPNEDKLKLLAADAGKATSGSENGANNSAALSNQLAVTQESLDSTRRENDELKDRMNDLQSQLDKLQRLIQLKDNQLAKLQADVSAPAGQAAGASESAVAAPATGELPADPAASSAEAGADAAANANAPAAPVDPVTEAPQAGAEVAPGASVDGTAPAEEPAAPAQPVPSEPAAPVVAEAPEPAAAAPEPVEEDSALDNLLANPMLLGLIGGSLLLALLLVLLILSRRNARKEAEQEESLAVYQEDTHRFDSDMELPADSLNDLPDDRATLLAPVGEERVTAQTGDALGEADIYIAYGRFNQAAELLHNAINDEPHRTDLRLKLMEVYAELGDRDGFARQESELREIGGAHAEVEQLKSRYPAMVMLGGAAALTSTATAADDLDSFSLDDLTLEEPAQPVASQPADDSFDLDLDALEAEFAADPLPQAQSADRFDEVDTLSLDSDLDLQTPQQPVASKREDDAFDIDFGSETDSRQDLGGELADFSLDLDSPATPVAKEDEFLLSLDDDADKSPANDDQNDFSSALAGEKAKDDFDLPADFDLSLNDEQPAPNSGASFAAQLDDVTAELDQLAESMEQQGKLEPEYLQADTSSLDDDEEFDFLSGTDETATKLDLARAYIDMGDSEGARDILDEVIAEGNEGQQQEARELIGKLV
ncbi:FimV/HubP family polar landmark protein [Phytopseudomonas seleniipraecipitans]|uniref:Pilus assembly protein FimV n=1 Tax=Phytopseudomonas seleniipraecipitans TaxID=640205 RepID=A0A1G7N9J7_9GAMM|nr:FimV/HubP family polar landmark protein [Pseudomonas seleniipraecipitans]SDF70728.1 pilus assembly protein FimV [Pseudomonas seleniipraecipitans]